MKNSKKKMIEIKSYVSDDIYHLLKKLTAKNGNFYIIFCDIPSRPIFDVIETRDYLGVYEKVINWAAGKRKYKKIFFLSSVAAVCPNILKKEYNSYRIEEFTQFIDQCKSNAIDTTLFLLPPLDTNDNLIAKIFFMEKRIWWARKILFNLQNKYKTKRFIFPNRFLGNVVVRFFFVLTSLRLKFKRC